MLTAVRKRSVSSTTTRRLSIVMLTVFSLSIRVDGFLIPSPSSTCLRPVVKHCHEERILRLHSETTDDDTWNVPSSAPEEDKPVLDGSEKAWRYAKKPLLSIGAKGASSSHGNSLKQLLEAHTAVKVKVNTRPFSGSLDSAFDALRKLAEENGAPAGIELIQFRNTENTILFGLPGTMDRIKDGTFPPPPPPPRPSEEEETE